MIFPYTTTGKSGDWVTAVGKNGGGVLACPSDTITRLSPISVFDGTNWVDISGQFTKRSYALPTTFAWSDYANANGLSQGFLPAFMPNPTPRMMATIPASAELYMIVEAHNDHSVPAEPQKGVGYGLLGQYNWHPNSGDLCDSIFWGGSKDQFDACYKARVPVHSGGYNYAFADGHAKWLRPEATTGKMGIYNRSSDGGFWTLDPND